MTKNLLRMTGILVGALAVSLHAQSHKKAANDSTIPKGAIHIVLKSTDDAKQVFVYASMLGIPEVPEPHDGLYRVEINEKGKVAAVTILKGISPNADTFVMKQLVAWYAKPGPVRVVDV